MGSYFFGGIELNHILIGNAIFLIGSLMMVAIGIIRGKNRILVVQCVQFTFMGIAQFILGGITGSITNAVSILRNVICVWVKFTLPYKLLFMGIQVIMTILVWPTTVIQWLPTVAACLYTWFLDTKSEKVLKTVMIVCQLFWVVFDFSIQNYVGVAFDLFTVVSTVAGILMLKKARAK